MKCVCRFLLLGFPSWFCHCSLILAAASICLAADPGEKKQSSIATGMLKFVASAEIAGSVTVVGNAEKILSFDVVGMSNLESRHEMERTTLFRIASMTKPITAVGIMILADEGKIDIESPVEKYLPEFRNQWLISEQSKDKIVLKKPARLVTIRDLLTHTSGFPGAMPDGLRELYARRNHSLAEAIMALSQRPLQFEPGSKWSYCNPGIDTLGRVIEVVSGNSYEDFLSTRIFEPLGMVDTTFYPNAQQLERAAILYSKVKGKLVPPKIPAPAKKQKVRYPIPAGGLFSTGDDLAKFYQMMLRQGQGPKGAILRVETVQKMTQSHTGDLAAGFTPGMAWGLGWGVVQKPVGVTAMLSAGTFGHGGAFGTQAWIDPHKKLFMVLLIQRQGLPNSDASAMREEFQNLAVSAFAPAPKP